MRTDVIVIGAVGLALAGVGVLVAHYVAANTRFAERDLAAMTSAGIVPKRADVDGHAIAYAEGPDNGPPLLLIHGQGSQWQDHALVLPELAARHHVFALDVPGHGGSDRLPAGEYTNVRVGGIIATFVERVIGGPAIVSGHSSGGLLAAWLAAGHPDLVTGLLLEDPPLYSSAPDRLGGTVGGVLPRLASEFLRTRPAGDFQRYYVEHGDYFAFFGGLARPIVRSALRYLDAHPGEPLRLAYLPPLVNVFFRGLVDYDPAFGEAFDDGSWYDGFDTDTVLAAVTCPTGLVHTNYWFERKGTPYVNDVLMAAMDEQDVARALERVPDAGLVSIASGHLVHYERPRRYLDTFDILRARIVG